MCVPNPQKRPRKQTSANGHVCFTPESGHVRCKSPCLLWAKSGLMQRSKRSLFDHLFGARDQRRRHDEAGRLGGFEVDHKLAFARRLDWQVSRLSAHAINVARRAPELVNPIGTVRDQSPAETKPRL